MKTPYFAMTPDYSPVVKLMAMQTHFAFETSHKFMQMAMMPWQGVPTPFGMFKAGLSITAPKAAEDLPHMPETVTEAFETVTHAVEEAADSMADTAVEIVEAVDVAAEDVAETTEAASTEVVETMAEAQVETVEDAEIVETAAETVETVAEDAAETVDTVAEAVEDSTVKPVFLAAPEGVADDLTALNGVGPKLAEALNEAGIYHYAQIAAWTEANAAWVDENVAGVRGRASRNGWAAQAADLAQ